MIGTKSVRLGKDVVTVVISCSVVWLRDFLKRLYIVLFQKLHDEDGKPRGQDFLGVLPQALHHKQSSANASIDARHA